jgi:magnesium chelatase family protein
VDKARAIQLQRYQGTDTLFNSSLNPRQIELYCRLGENEEKLMKKAFTSLNLSSRAYHRILKLARTIADLDNSEDIKTPHIAEAVQYRSLDRKYWL